MAVLTCISVTPLKRQLVFAADNILIFVVSIVYEPMGVDNQCVRRRFTRNKSDFECLKAKKEVVTRRMCFLNTNIKLQQTTFSHVLLIFFFGLSCKA